MLNKISINQLQTSELILASSYQPVYFKNNISFWIQYIQYV